MASPISSLQMLLSCQPVERSIRPSRLRPTLSECPLKLIAVSGHGVSWLRRQPCNWDDCSSGWLRSCGDSCILANDYAPRVSCFAEFVDLLRETKYVGEPRQARFTFPAWSTLTNATTCRLRGQIQYYLNRQKSEQSNRIHGMIGYPPASHKHR
jgi:hypothetical protein